MNELLSKLNLLSESQFSKVKQIYAMTNKISATTREDFAVKAVDKSITQGVINLINKELGL